MSLELRWLHLLLHFKILPTQHLRKQLAIFYPMVWVLVYSYEDKALGSNIIIRACVKLFVVFTTGENGDFRYKAMCLYLTSSSLIQHFHELAKFHAAVVSRFITICLSSSQELPVLVILEDNTWLDEQMLLLFGPSGILICQIYFCNYCSLHNCMQWQYDMAAWHTAKATKHKVIKMSQISVYFVEYLWSLYVYTVNVLLLDQVYCML